MIRTNIRISIEAKEKFEKMGGLAALRLMLSARMAGNIKSDPEAFDGMLDLIIRVRDERLRGTLIVFAQESFSVSHDYLMTRLDERLNLS